MDVYVKAHLVCLSKTATFLQRQWNCQLDWHFETVLKLAWPHLSQSSITIYSWVKCKGTKIVVVQYVAYYIFPTTTLLRFQNV